MKRALAGAVLLCPVRPAALARAQRHGVHARNRPCRASSSSPMVMAAWIRPTWV